MPEDYIRIIEQAGELDDSEINLAKIGLSIAAIQGAVGSIERYENHIQKLCDQVRLRFDALVKAGAEDSAATRLASLKHIIADKHEYKGDDESYDDLQNVNLIRVIERRKGMPVSLALLYIHIGRAQGWVVEALNFPAHVICRIEHAGERLLFDPFNSAQAMQAHDLRNMLKEIIGPQAELSSDYYEAALNREVLIRMQNNIKLRQIEGEDYEGALNTINIMQLLDPKEYRLLFDAGVLYARTHQVKAAIDALEDYIDLAQNFDDKQDAILLLGEIKNSLN